MLEAGEIDAYFGARRPAALDKGKNVARLFPDYREREKDYYRRTKFHPIMHTLVIREDLYKQQPWIPESLFKACQEAKAWGLKQMQFSGAQRSMLPWLFDEIAEMLALMGPETVVPAAVYLVSEDAPTNAIINAGGGGFERAYVTLTRGIHVSAEDMTAETVAARFAEISDRTGEIVPDTGGAQGAMALGGRS
jgi:hypothetical protein